MIDSRSLSGEWLAEKRNKHGKDPSIMEAMIHALYLLEQISLTGLDFIFKGGTSLVLLLEKPQRFSVDIDIIVKPETKREDLEKHLSKIIGNSVFIRMELDDRRSYKEGIPKAHYKFVYRSNVPAKNQKGEAITNPEREILLDVLFSDHHYPVLIDKPIHTDWLIVSGDAIMVKVPDVNSIAGDKLTAFAPNTTGVPYQSDKEKEIIKQIFDIGHLFDLVNDLPTFRKAYEATAKGEIQYRPERKIESIEQILKDTIDTAILIARKDVQLTAEDKVRFAELQAGINQFGHFVYIGNFRIEHAQVASAKAAYLSAIVLSNHEGEIQRFHDQIPLAEYMIAHPEYNFLNKRLKFVAKGEALFYWYQIINLLFK